MTVTIDDFGASFEFFMPNVIEILNSKILAYQICKGKTMNWEGTKASKHINVNRSSALTFVSDGGAIPAAKKQGYQKAAAYRKFAAGKVSITDGLLNNADTTEHAAISVLESELRKFMTGAEVFFNYFWTRDGTGVVTTLGSTVSGATITVPDARALWDQGDFTILATDGSTVRTTFTVQSVARAYNNSTLLSTVTPTASVANNGNTLGDYIVWGTGDGMCYGKALTGLDAGIDDASGTFQEIVTSTYNKYTSPVFSNSGTPRALTPSLFRRVLTTLVQESNGSNKKTVLSTNPILSQMDEMFESAVRLTPDSGTVGQSTPAFQSTMGRFTVQGDKDCKRGTMFFVDPGEITLLEQKAWGWRSATNGGGGIFLRDDAALRYTATAMWQGELFYEARNKMAKVKDIEETVDTSW